MIKWEKTSKNNLPPLETHVLGIYKKNVPAFGIYKNLLHIIYLEEIKDDYEWESLKLCGIEGYEIDGIRLMWCIDFPRCEIYSGNDCTTSIVSPSYWSFISVPETEDKVKNEMSKNRFEFLDI